MATQPKLNPYGPATRNPATGEPLALTHGPRDGFSAPYTGADGEASTDGGGDGGQTFIIIESGEGEEGEQGPPGIEGAAKNLVPVKVTASRALDATYTAPASNSILVSATVRCAAQ